MTKTIFGSTIFLNEDELDYYGKWIDVFFDWGDVKSGMYHICAELLYNHNDYWVVLRIQLLIEVVMRIHLTGKRVDI